MTKTNTTTVAQTRLTKLHRLVADAAAIAGDLYCDAAAGSELEEIGRMLDTILCATAAHAGELNLMLKAGRLDGSDNGRDLRRWTRTLRTEIADALRV
jgi:hypothetical protein